MQKVRRSPAFYHPPRRKYVAEAVEYAYLFTRIVIVVMATNLLTGKLFVELLICIII